MKHGNVEKAEVCFRFWKQRWDDFILLSRKASNIYKDTRVQNSVRYIGELYLYLGLDTANSKRLFYLRG